ncbi:MAG: TIGR02996 domain-containing protein [Myxococcaceae bacterium]|nr:TIGR02996 domain-containing protein [Myxococcaceae bacterium]
MTLERLYRDVYESPGDDRRRLVLADALLERADPRGELIMLQFQTHALARKRAKKLIDRHRAQFLGPLCNVVKHGSDEWRKGFLVGCVAHASGATADCPAWATVKRIDVLADRTAEVDLLASKWLRSLEEVRVLSDDETFWRGVHVAQTRVKVLRVLERTNRVRLLKA